MSSQKFAQRLKLPPRTQKRLDHWQTNVPKWQHQVYGPLNSYLTTAFPLNMFIVKPQSLLREQSASSPDDNDNDWDEGTTLDSIDSRGQAVTKTRSYPDFCVDQYWGADDDSNFKADIIRVIVEVGSRTKSLGDISYTRVFIQQQLEGYMEAVGPQRWEGLLLGVCMLGSEVLLMRMAERDNDNVDADWNPSKDPSVSPQFVFTDSNGNPEWISMFDARFDHQMENVYRYCLAHD
ncbi:hypothetical protein J3R30DRAFT_2385713 [Lentinula aciculospora]|uniref:Uncharacterized protein n=1 Tax=Lentinula aciculospora TaxID=153920 RepID=A0A9W9AFK5_9AGAR|nr:hypothetical protein J3R30DRAFT_2385713 [Lentinula aciculospora]